MGVAGGSARRAWLSSSMLALALLAPSGCNGCNKSPEATTDGGTSSDALPPVVISNPTSDGDAAVDPKKRPTTTSWSIAGENLGADIAERTKKYSPHVEERSRLFDLLITRAQFVADIADYERADELSEANVKSYPKDAEAHIARASVHNALHRFQAAEKELDAAAKLNGDPVRIASTRASVLLATGRYDEADKIIPPVTEKTRPIALVTRAVLAAHMQRADESERLFDLARTRLVDVSPFPVAWMDFQRARALEMRGLEKEARHYYAEAVDVIPVYAHAAVHLAPTDPPTDAITRLEALRKTSTDPDVIAALAEAHKRAGHTEETKTVTTEAQARYDALVAKHPEAYRDHAARFYLGLGNDPKKALDFAEKNAALRPTEEALDLWMAAATAANDKAKICASAAAMHALRYASPERKRLAAASVKGCPDAGAAADKK